MLPDKLIGRAAWDAVADRRAMPVIGSGPRPTPSLVSSEDRSIHEAAIRQHADRLLIIHAVNDNHSGVKTLPGLVGRPSPSACG